MYYMSSPSVRLPPPKLVMGGQKKFQRNYMALSSHLPPWFALVDHLLPKEVTLIVWREQQARGTGT